VKLPYLYVFMCALCLSAGDTLQYLISSFCGVVWCRYSSLVTRFMIGEDVVRESGIPSTIIRPCALTEEPWIAGPRDPMIPCLEYTYAPSAPFVSDHPSVCTTACLDRDDIAELAVESLLTPEASGLTFEVKSDLAFSTLWEGAPEGDAGRNYG